VVAPAAADLEVARREALELEAAAARERDRRRVARLDVRLEPVQVELRERMPQNQPEPLGHVAAAGVGGDRAVAQERTLQPAADDLADVREADDRRVLTPADEQRLERLVGRPCEQRRERLVAGRRLQPRVVERSTRPHRRDELRAVVRGRYAQLDAGHRLTLASVVRT
jgi:hypothetical protein